MTTTRSSTRGGKAAAAPVLPLGWLGAWSMAPAVCVLAACSASSGGEPSAADRLESPAVARDNTTLAREEGDVPASASVDRNDSPAFAPFETRGEPLPGSPSGWTYTEFPGAQCRDGSPAGVAVNLGTSKKLLIYLEGGGWCVDAQTCEGNRSDTSLQVVILSSLGFSDGAFNRDNSENPVHDWNFVYVPYCTGDLHAGANPFGDVPGVGPQKFVGSHNMKQFLDRIVPTFADTTDVILAGSSAGGYGALLNSVLVQRAFPKLKVKTVIDSAPPLSKAVFTACLQTQARTLFGFDKTFLADCGAACPNPDDYMEEADRLVGENRRRRQPGPCRSVIASIE